MVNSYTPDFNENLSVVKRKKVFWNEGCLLADFAGYHLEGLLISHAKFSEKVSNEQQENENNL